MCQLVIEHTVHHGLNPAWKETWLCFADEDQNLKRYDVKDCHYPANKDIILKELMNINLLINCFQWNRKRTTACRAAPERLLSYELESGEPYSPEIEHLKRKLGEGDFE